MVTKIVFKNGTTIEITQKALAALADQIQKGANKWQFFTSEKDSSKVIGIINLDEVVCSYQTEK